MFKKRERPADTRHKEIEDEEASSSVPLFNKRARGTIKDKGVAATTRKGEDHAATVAAQRSGDAAFSGIKATGGKVERPSDDAVRLLETETEAGKDTRAVLERNLQIHKGLKEGTLEEGVYRGRGAYKRYIEKSEGAISNSKYSGLLGPTRNTMANVRSTLRIEYWGTTGEGGVCKDYKETGYCGWGDTCKFLHDRSDYKPGYVLEREFEEQQKAIEEKRRKQWEKRLSKKGGEGADDASENSQSDSDEDLPKACPVCDRNWRDCTSPPVVTICGHHFCEECALSHFVESPKCVMCDAPTNGIFNVCEALEVKQKSSVEPVVPANSAAPQVEESGS